MKRQILNKKTNNYIIVFDLETDGLKVEEGIDNINQIGGVAIDVKNLTMDKENAFAVDVRPHDIDDEDYYEKHKGGIDFHLRWTKKPLDELMEKWRNGISEKVALKKFKEWVGSYKTTEPLLFGGQNIKSFDMPILIERYKHHKITGCPVAYRNKPISAQRTWDLYDITHKWFLFSEKYPYKYNMDSIREFFSMGSDSAHDALQDVFDEGEVLLRFLRLYKHISPKIDWLGEKK